jgi:hypothetical protein
MEILNESMEIDTFEYHVSKPSSYFNKSCNHVRQSLDFGYESLLSSASFNMSKNEPASHNVTASDYNFSQPSTPVKKMTATIQSATTPNRNILFPLSHPSTYVADVNGMYLASVSSSYQSPYKLSSSSSFSQFSASSSNSPINKLTQSPKFVLNTDSYINEKDDVKTKLLRSPAFKLTCSNSKKPYCTSERPVVRSFSSRFNNYASSTTLSTPTQEEFVERLIKNRLMPDNPEFLIGRRMGLDNVDILSELNQRSMNNVLDLIYSHLNPSDLVKIACVSKQWRQLIKQNSKLNEQRVQHIKLRRKIYFNTKENHNNSAGLNDSDFRDLQSLEMLQPLRPNQMSAKQKRDAFKRLREKTYAGISTDETPAFAFASLDLNCISNLDSKHSISGSRQLSASNCLTDEFINTVREVNRNLHDKAKHSNMDKEYRQISFNENEIQINRMKAKLIQSSGDDNDSSSMAASQLNEKIQINLAKKLKQQSPVKKSPRKVSQSPHKVFQLSPLSAKQNRIDLIGSKKSKKNLKRL